MGKPNRQTVLLLAAGVLAVVFSLGFFAGRSSVPYEISAQTGHAAASEESAPQEEAAAEASQEDAAQTEHAAQGAQTVDLNAATREELMTLPGIGETLAQRILDYRAQYGRFSAPEQLMDVEGIGEAKFEGLRELIKVGDSK